MLNARNASVDRVRAALESRGVHVEIREFPASTRTAAEAAAAIGTGVAQIVKSLLFVAGAEPLLVLMSGVNRLDPDALALVHGSPAGKADADLVRRVTGYAIGGVPPVGFPQPITTYVDRDLLNHQVVWAAAGTPHHVFALTPAELVALTDGVVAELRARE